MTASITPLVAPWGRFSLYTFFIDAEQPAVVDTGIATTPEDGMAPELEKLGKRAEDIQWILLTHGHIDHLGGAHALWEMTGRRARVVIHEEDLKYLQARRSHVDNYLALRDNYIDNPGAEAEQTDMANKAISGEMTADVVVTGGETLDLGDGTTVSVVHVPGHSMGSVAYVVDGQNDVFVGDAVQVHGAANGFPGYEDPDVYRASLDKLLEMEPRTMYMGHPYRSADGVPYPVSLDEQAAHEAIVESLRIEERIRAAAKEIFEHGAGESDSVYSPFEAIAETLEYEGDPTLEPSPFFTTLDGYRRLYG